MELARFSSFSLTSLAGVFPLLLQWCGVTDRALNLSEIHNDKAAQTNRPNTDTSDLSLARPSHRASSGRLLGSINLVIIIMVSSDFLCLSLAFSLSFSPAKLGLCPSSGH